MTFFKKLFLLSFLLTMCLFSESDAKKLFKQAKGYYSQGKYNIAKDLLLKIITADPINNQAYFYLANIEFNLNAFNEADKNYQKALDLKPNNPIYLLNYGNLKYKQKLWAVAEQLYFKCERSDESDHRAQERLAMLYFRQFYFNKSADRFEKVLAVNPAHIDRSNIEKWIIKLREKAPEADKLRDRFAKEGKDIDAANYSDILNIDFDKLTHDAETESKGEDTIKDFDADLDIVE